MKLRVRGNSIRIRVTQTELEEIGSTGEVLDGASFGGGRRLGYALKRDPAARAVSARFDHDTVTVLLPADIVERWVNSSQVSITGEQPADGEPLKILVEKDFACLEPRPGEDDSDMFPHPEAGTRC